MTNVTSKTITGIVLIFGGIFVFFLPFLFGIRLGMFSLLYSVPMIIIGLFIILNKNEDKIEKIKKRK